MPILNYKGLLERDAWEAAGIKLPKYDPGALAERTIKNPVWLHFSAGNLFRAYIASLQDKLLNEGFVDHGIISVETYDPEIIDKVYTPHDNLCIVVTLKPESGGAAANGGARNNGVVISSVSKAYSTANAVGYEEVRRAFINPGLQMVSLTVSEKAYSLRGADGGFLPDVATDIKNGPARPTNIMTVIATMLYERYKAGAFPIALASMDNCSRNGERLRSSVLEIVDLWTMRGLCMSGFAEWLNDESRVAFPWSMIDKITPWPSGSIAKRLEGSGIPDMAPVTTARGTVVAPFVNTEPFQYLVIEDAFPNGRPPLDKVGVIFADRETVNRAERMKVATCLNPLHTSLAIFGLLLGFKSIAEEMKDSDLSALIHRIAYDEGLPAVDDPGVIDPIAFVEEVINLRLPNPMIPDTPARIATDTSQKIAIRFGGTIRFHMERQTKEVSDNIIDKSTGLTGIPLVIAGWLRYLLAVDDNLRSFTPSPDPMLSILRDKLSQITIDADGGAAIHDAEKIKAIIDPILSDKSLFGADLRAAGLTDKINAIFIEMLDGAGAVRRTLKKYLYKDC